MSAPIRTRISSALGATRAFTSTASVTAEASTSKRPPTRRQPLAEYDIRKMEEFKFDDATSLGFMRLEKIREAQELVKRVEVDKQALQGMFALHEIEAHGARGFPWGCPLNSVCRSMSLTLQRNARLSRHRKAPSASPRSSTSQNPLRPYTTSVSSSPLYPLCRSPTPTPYNASSCLLDPGGRLFHSTRAAIAS